MANWQTSWSTGWAIISFKPRNIGVIGIGTFGLWEHWGYGNIGAIGTLRLYANWGYRDVGATGILGL